MREFLYLFATMGLVSFLFAGCAKQPASRSPVSSDARVLKVAVFADGQLTVDGATSTIAALRESLQTLSDKQGVVWYYREAGQKEPPPIAMEVMKAVVEARLPIRLSSRPDYSDFIRVDGRQITK